MTVPVRAAWFLARFAGALVGLLYVWPYLTGAYAACAAALGNALLPASSAAALEFAVAPFDANAPESLGVVLSVRTFSPPNLIAIPVDLYNLTYLPTATLVALALATPIWSGPRALLLLTAALVVLNVFLVASVAGPLALFFANPVPIHLVDMSPFTHAALDVLYRTLVAPPGMSYAIPGLVWLALLCLCPSRPARRVHPVSARVSPA